MKTFKQYLVESRFKDFRFDKRSITDVIASAENLATAENIISNMSKEEREALLNDINNKEVSKLDGTQQKQAIALSLLMDRAEKKTDSKSKNVKSLKFTPERAEKALDGFDIENPDTFSDEVEEKLIRKEMEKEKENDDEEENKEDDKKSDTSSKDDKESNSEEDKEETEDDEENNSEEDKKNNKEKPSSSEETETSIPSIKKERERIESQIEDGLNQVKTMLNNDDLDERRINIIKKYQKRLNNIKTNALKKLERFEDQMDDPANNARTKRRIQRDARILKAEIDRDVSNIELDLGSKGKGGIKTKRTVGEKIKGRLKDFENKAKEAGEKFSKSKAGEITQKVMDKATEIGKKGIDKAKEMAPKVRDKAQEIGSKISSFAKETAPKVKDNIENAKAAATKFAKENAAKLGKGFSELRQSALDAIKKFKEKSKNKEEKKDNPGNTNPAQTKAIATRVNANMSKFRPRPIRNVTSTGNNRKIN